MFESGSATRESQARIAERWREYSQTAADAGDFESWRRAGASARGELPGGSRDGPHTVEITAPTGHRYIWSAPPLVHHDPGTIVSPLERAVDVALAA